MEYRDEMEQFKKYVKIGIFGGVAGLLLILAIINCYTVDTGFSKGFFIPTILLTRVAM